MLHHLISIMIVLPFAGALAQALLPRASGNSTSRWLALGASIVSALCAFVLVLSLHSQIADMQFKESLDWIGSYSIRYEVGVDGLSALLVLLVSLIFPVLVAYEWNRKDGVRGMQGLLLLLQGSLLGALCAQDLFLLVFFWGITLLPGYFMIGVWGGKNRERAAFQNLISGAIGSAFVFAAMVLVYHTSDPHTFSLAELAGSKLSGKTFEILGADYSVAPIAFSLFALGLALRAGIWPFHGWLALAAEEAPPSVFVAMASASAPVACSIFIKICYPLFPETTIASASALVVVGIVTLLIAALSALAQRSMRTLLAYLAVAQTGLFLMGAASLSSAGVVGSLTHLFGLSLGIAIVALLSGSIETRIGTSVFRAESGETLISGLVSRAPMISVLCGIGIASLIGIPGLAGFVGQSLIIIGAFATHPLSAALTSIALLLGIYALLNMFRCVFLGEETALASTATDLSFLEKVYLFPLIFFVVGTGIYPKLFVETVRPAVVTLLSSIK